MKKISIVVPCYNEEENIEALVKAIEDEFLKNLSEYDYEIIFIDNDSKDRTRDIIRVIASTDARVKGIFNAKNFGQFKSPYYGLLQAEGDATILLACDFQDPIYMITEFVKGWEEGYKIVIGRKTNSDESKIVYKLRGMYYSFVKKFSEVEQISQYTGFGLYDKKFIEVLRQLDDPTPFLRGVVAELGYKRKEIEYTQPKRRAGKTKNNWYTLYDGAMLSLTSYTKIGLRLATFVGFGGAFLSFLVGLIYFIMKLCNWNGFEAGQAPLVCGMSFVGCLILLFVGLIGEYILAINERVMHRPLVIEEERIGEWKGLEKDE